MRGLLVILIVILKCSVDTVLAQAPLIGNTESPVLLKSASIAFAMTEEEYGKLVKRLSKNPSFVPVKRKPPKLTANARFGVNLSFGGLNRGWVLDGNSKDGYVLYADFNGNGDLTDESPVKFENDKGKYSRLMARTVTEKVNGKDESYPMEFRLEVTDATHPDKSERQLGLKIFFKTLRKGVIRVGEKDIAFALSGSQGVYDWDYNRVYFDMNGDGLLDMDSTKSFERYDVLEKHVNLGGVSYEFIVDRYGRSLTLKPLAEKLPDRAILQPGTPAPEFSVTDIDGKQHRLSDYQGKVVLIDFWGIWCAPCVAEVPKLVAAYKKLHAKGFAVISVHLGGELDEVRKFIVERQMSWTHAMEKDGGPLIRLFRVDGYPTYYLISRDGLILANDLRPGEQLIKEVEKQFDDK